MRDTWKIALGLVLFVGLFTFPAWYDAAKGRGGEAPDPVIATRDVPGKDRCVLEAERMRTSHMELLNDWREQVVRGGRRIYTAPDGRRFAMSLSNTCMQCHPNKDTFCDRCHDYAAVEPYCWDCHVAPEPAAGEAALTLGEGTR